MTFRSRFIIATVSIFSLLPLLGCGSARRGEPLTRPSAFSQEARQGNIVFAAHCHQCHPGGEGGLGPALNNKPLPGFMIKMQVRHGIGAMPSFSNVKVTDKDLDNIVAYMKAQRNR
ncbi:MAG: cytochrome c [Desulfobacteraceae bacterium]|nr:MAG: cytochrome c [Desulfobacteraceae bacterium]